MIELLYKKKVIRDFLSLFTENNWKPLISSLVEYGIINLKKQHNIASSTADEIIHIVESLKRSENLTENKQKLTINKILNKNISANKSSQSRSRSVSKTNSDNNFTKNIQKKSNTSTSKSKTQEIILKNQTLKKVNSSKQSQNNFPPKNRNSSSVKAPEKIQRENSSAKLIRSSSKDEKNKKNQFSIKKYSKNLNESDTEGNWNNKSNTNTPALNKSYSTLDHKNTNTNVLHQDRNNFNTNTEKKKNTNQILEQINIQKLKEKMKKNEPEATEEEIKVPNISKKYSKVGSRIRTEIDKDKKIFNLIKTANEREAENISDKKNNNTNIRQINTKNSENAYNNSNRNRLDSQSDSETAPNRKNNHMMSTRANLASGNQEAWDSKKENLNQPGNTAAMSLEDRLNGLTKKISEVEKNSKYSDLNIDSPYSTNYNYNLTNNYNKYDSSPLAYKEDPIGQQSKKVYPNANEAYQDKTSINAGNTNYKFSYTDMAENTEDNEENYLSEEKFDINKYKYLYANNYGEDQEHSQNSQDEDQY